MPKNLTLPTNITPGTTATFEQDVEAAWAFINDASRDTGWRNVTSLLANGWTATAVYVRRIDEWVFWEFRTLDGSAATTAAVMPMTAFVGFRGFGGTNETPLWRGVGGVNGYLRFSGTSLGAEIGFRFPASTVHSHAYPTADTWPTVLPGIPA